MAFPRTSPSQDRWLDRLIPRYAQLPLLASLLWNLTVYYGSKLLTRQWPHHQMGGALDAKIPFLPWTACIYLGCYLFWAVNYVLTARQSRQRMERLLSADFLAKAGCFLCFLVYPTTISRPQVSAPGFWNSVIRFIYRQDTPVNLFPSIHCLISWFSWLGVRKQKGIPRWYRGFSLGAALAVFVSTLTTRQHVLADVLGGAALAGLSWWITVPSGFAARYGRFFDRVSRRKRPPRDGQTILHNS